MPYRFQSLKGVYRYLDLVFNKHKKNWDTVICICGAVGVGKSNLALHMLEYWNKKLYGKVSKSDIKHVCLDSVGFLHDLADCKQYEMTIYDEAGELSSRNAMNKLNKMIMVTYQIIRADKIFTVLILPDIWYLDSYFRNTRVKGLFVVSKRGKVAFWNYQKLRKIIDLNQSRNIKNYWVTPPNFTDSYPMYKGILMEEYEKLKAKKTSEARQKLKEVVDENGNEIRDLKINAAKKMSDLGLTHDSIASCLNVSRRTIGNYIKEYDSVAG